MSQVIKKCAYCLKDFDASFGYVVTTRLHGRVYGLEFFCTPKCLSEAFAPKV